jgi:hypothetical protein
MAPNRPQIRSNSFVRKLASKRLKIFSVTNLRFFAETNTLQITFSRTDGKCFSVGSGSVYAYGVLDNGYREDLTDEEAYDLARRSIYHATYRDAASGGIIRGFKFHFLELLG